MRSTEKKKRYIFDLILVCVLLAIGLSVYFLVYRANGNGQYATVYVAGEAVAEYPLAKDGEYTLNSGTNILKIENGEAYMLYAECPDGWCKNQGRIYLSGERITCLPNRVMIMIKGAGK